MSWRNYSSYYQYRPARFESSTVYHSRVIYHNNYFPIFHYINPVTGEYNERKPWYERFQSRSSTRSGPGPFNYTI